MSYIGTEPKDIRSFGRTQFDYTATQGQTAFTGADDDGKVLAFTTGQINVYVNGILMDDSDFTTTGTGTVTLASAANLNDIISIVSFESNIPDNDYVPASGGTFTGAVTHSGAVTHTGAFTSQGIDDNANATAITIDSSENIGIGTSSPARKFHLHEATSSTPVVFAMSTNTTGATTGDGFNISIDGSSSAVNIIQRENADMQFYTNGGTNERMRILAGGGITFNGDTAAANALDDYEEGNWTPTVHQGGYGLTVSMARYNKIGRQVTILADLTLTGSGNSSDLIIGGLPFTNSYLGYASGAGYTQVWPGGNHFTPTVGSSETLVRFMNGSGAYYDANNFSTGYINFTITYLV